MAARKSRARRITPPSTTEPDAPTPEPVNVPPSDPRPEAWRGILLASAKGEAIPRELRVHADSRFTGAKRVAQVQAITYIGKTPEEATDAVLRAAMDEHRGEKNCNW